MFDQQREESSSLSSQRDGRAQPRKDGGKVGAKIYICTNEAVSPPQQPVIHSQAVKWHDNHEDLFHLCSFGALIWSVHNPFPDQ